MRQDILTKQTVDRRTGGSVNYKMERGTVGSLLFLIANGTWSYADIITIKLRHSGGTDVVIDRIPALDLALLCDLKKGRPTFGNSNQMPDGAEQTDHIRVNETAAFPVNSFKVPLGHLSLADSQSELEIHIDCAKAFGNAATVKIANIEGPSSPDYILQYDKSADLESTHFLVRELFLVGKKGASFFNGSGDTITGKDIQLQLRTDNDTFETDVEVLGANTAIDGELSIVPNTMLMAYQDNEALPTPSLRVKVSGEDAKLVTLFFIKEKMIQKLTSVSTIQQVERALVKTEAIEKMGDGVAKAYRHAGSTKKSGELAQIKAAVTAKTPEA